MPTNRISWDEPGERQYFTGVDRGVLYPQLGVGKPWNGLVSVSSGQSREVKPYYIDGIKFLDHEVLGEWQGKLTAFTYPDILDEILGVYTYTSGVFAHDQPSQTFNLSYRTRVGNDLDGDEAGYITHVIYNIRAIPDEVTHATQAGQTDPLLFSWTLTSTPPALSGLRPTAHISFDSRQLSSDLQAQLEEALYGSEFQPPVLSGKDMGSFLNSFTHGPVVDS